MKTRIRDWLLALAGLVAAPVVWAINMQLSQILPYPQCQNGKPLLLATSMVALLVALLGAGLSWRLRTRLSHVEGHRTQGFVAGASGLLGAAFAFALVLQVMATMVLTGCEH